MFFLGPENSGNLWQDVLYLRCRKKLLEKFALKFSQTVLTNIYLQGICLLKPFSPAKIRSVFEHVEGVGV